MFIKNLADWLVLLYASVVLKILFNQDYGNSHAVWNYLSVSVNSPLQTNSLFNAEALRLLAHNTDNCNKIYNKKKFQKPTSIELFKTK